MTTLFQEILNEKLTSSMLIFVILSTTEAYFPKLPQPQSRPHHPYQQRSGALLCRLSDTVFCSPPLLPCSPPKPSLRPHLPPLCRPVVFYPATSPCPIFCSPLRPCYPLVPCPLSRSLFPLSSPSPPAASPPQHHNDIKSTSASSSKFTSYMDGISGSYQNSYKAQLFNDGYLMNDTEDVAGLLVHSSFPEKSTTGATYRIYPSETLNITNPEATELLPSDQQLNYPSDVYSSTSSQQQQPQIVIAGKDGLGAETTKSAQKHETKYLIKSNCSLNGSKCGTDDFTVPPENDCCTNCSIPCRFRYVKRTSFGNDQLQEVDPVCNNELLRQIITGQTDDNINKSKNRIERTARWLLGGLFGVICGNGNFAYIIQTKDFCQHRKGNVTCYIFRSLTDHSKSNIL
ncbi:hypothetical protein LOAG_09010 [Loa loa]|uniref:Ground-like domain-containing protein n=1 Tax=Loa loa TaxID=7209 RepID=A0A1I7VNH1_LOALO|nr:hypothetical protein LOAG_09010 [Loa loa]EFO19482.1 hypothetical protein LOAG_09010 [Loa loa]